MQRAPQPPMQIPTILNPVIPKQTANVITAVRPTIPVPTVVVPTIIQTQTQLLVPTAVAPVPVVATTTTQHFLPQAPPLGQQTTVRVPTVIRPTVPPTPTVQVPTMPKQIIPATPTVQVPTMPKQIIPATPKVPIPTGINVARPIVPPVPKVTIPAEGTVVQPIILPAHTVQPQTIVLQNNIPQPIVPKAQPAQVAQGGILKRFGGAGTGVVAVTATPQMTAAPVINIVEETGYSILNKLLPVWNGKLEQVQQLADQQYVNGAYIVDVNRRDVLMEIIGMLTRQEFEDVIDFLTDAPDPAYILWDQESMDEGRMKVAREMVIQQAAEIGVKGVGKCRYCPSTELVFALKQLRSGDEPATIFVRCVMCQKQWRQ